MIGKLLPLLVLIVSPAFSSAQWAANWITHPDVDGPQYNVLLFRHAVELPTVPDSFPLAISADNQFRLYVNDSLVAFGPQLGAVDYYHYDPVDVAPYLKPGRNLFAIQVVNFGHLRMFGMQSVHTGLLVQGYGPAEALTTDSDHGWRVWRDEAYRPNEVYWRNGTRNTIIGGLYANNPGDDFTARHHPWGWRSEVFNDGDWPAATFLEAGHLVKNGSGFLWRLQPRATPPQQLRRVPIGQVDLATRRTPEGWALGDEPLRIAPNDSVRLLIDHQAVEMGLVSWRWSGGAGALIRATYAENLFRPDRTKPHRDTIAGTIVKGYLDTVNPDGGRGRRFMPNALRTFRYIEVVVKTAAEPLELYAPELWQARSTVPITARWASDDAELDSIVAAATRTVAICTQDYFLSDAYYETMQYVGDTKVHALVWQGLTGDYRHIRNALRQFHQGRNSDGVLKSCYPLRYNFYHSSYSMIWVDMLADYLRETGDADGLVEYLPGVRQTLDYFHRHWNPESAMLEGIPYKSFVDWYVGGWAGMSPGNTDDTSVPYVLQYLHAMQSAVYLLEALDEEGPYQSIYTARADAVRRAIRKVAWNEERGLLAERPSHDFFDQHANILGILTGVIEPSEVDEVLEKTVRDTTLSPATYYFRYYLLEAITRADRADLFREATDLWYVMIREGATTMVERLESPKKPTRSEVHPWGASPALFVHELLAGVTIDAQGEVTMEPAWGHLTQMRGRYRGVTYDLKLTDGRAVGTISIDGPGRHTVRANGETHVIELGEELQIE